MRWWAAPGDPPSRVVQSCLARWELRVRQRGGEIRRWCLRGEADHCAVDVDPARPVRRGLAGRRVNAGEQVGSARGEVEDLVLVDLALVQTFFHGLVRPEAELCVPQRAVGVGVAR